jgi:hypothetical protein
MFRRPGCLPQGLTVVEDDVDSDELLEGREPIPIQTTGARLRVPCTKMGIWLTEWSRETRSDPAMPNPRTDPGPPNLTRTWSNWP